MFKTHVICYIFRDIRFKRSSNPLKVVGVGAIGKLTYTYDLPIDCDCGKRRSCRLAENFDEELKWTVKRGKV